MNQNQFPVRIWITGKTLTAAVRMSERLGLNVQTVMTMAAEQGIMKMERDGRMARKKK